MSHDIFASGDCTKKAQALFHTSSSLRSKYATDATGPNPLESYASKRAQWGQRQREAFAQEGIWFFVGSYGS